MQRKKICFNNILCVFLVLFILSSSQLSPILKEKSSFKKEQKKEQEGKVDQNKTPEFHKYSVEAILPIIDFKTPELVFCIISLPNTTRCFASNFYIGKAFRSSILKKLFTYIIAANAP